MADKEITQADWEHDPLDRFANVDNTTAGFTELRIHGVSGPQPSSVLEYPLESVTLVKGNADSGFWRRWRLGGNLQDVENQDHIEAYCWGGLTSRASLQAMWLLLLPFSLINLAHWMLPSYTDRKDSKLNARVAVALLRVIALSFTVTLALAGAEITMDLAAWQCGASKDCRETLGPWGLIAKVGDRTGLRLAIAGVVLSLMLVPILVAGARRLRPLQTGANASSPLVRRYTKSDSSENGPILGDPSFWVVDTSTRWLRLLHAVAWCVVIGAIATGALFANTVPGDAGHNAALWLLRINLIVLGGVFCLVIPQYFGRGGNGPKKRPGNALVTVPLALLAVALLAASLIATSVFMPDRAEGQSQALPWVQGAMGRLAFAQFVLLVALAVCINRLASGAKQDASTHVGYKPMLGGWLGFVVACLGWMLGLALSAGLGLWVADRLEGAVNGPSPSEIKLQLISPTFYQWIDVCVLLGALVVIGWAFFLAFRVLRETREETSRIKEEHTATSEGVTNNEPKANSQEEAAQARTAARWRIGARSIETIPLMLMGVTLTGLAVAGLSAVAYLRAVGRNGGVVLIDAANSPSNWYPAAGWVSHLPSIGAWLTTTGTVGVLTIAYAAYRKQSTRRIVGILWDVTTFWPRANHPLTPACTAERTVPQLANRVVELTKKNNDGLVLSAHSQGTILAAAVVLYLEQHKGQSDALSRVALLTYGSPLRRLYARAFPAYFSDQVLEQVRDDVGKRWRNLWARTDPIGADIGLPEHEQEAELSEETRTPADQTDWLMHPDPLTLAIDPRTGKQVSVCDHSGYLKRPEYPKAVKRLRGMMRPDT